MSMSTTDSATCFINQLQTEQRTRLLRLGMWHCGRINRLIKTARNVAFLCQKTPRGGGGEKRGNSCRVSSGSPEVQG